MSEWPAPVAEQALHGPAGEFVLRTEPHSETHPMALLAQFLVAFGTACGRGAHYQVEADRHHSNQFVVLAGPTATGRKGSSWGHVRRLLADADPAFARCSAASPPLTPGRATTTREWVASLAQQRSGCQHVSRASINITASDQSESEAV